MADKIDLKKIEKAYFTSPKSDFAEETFRAFSYLKVNGQCSPGDSPEYHAALEVLYLLAYAIKFFSKQELGRDYVVPPLEGLCLSKLHLGPFADEAPVLYRLHNDVIPEGGYAFNGHHHEIYLSDPRRTPPAKLRTILRQPVKRAI